MAIYLKTEQYCQDCNQFQVDVLQYRHGSTDRINTHIFCKHKEKCKAIREYLEDERRKGMTQAK